VGELRCSGSVNNSCSGSGIRRVTYVLIIRGLVIFSDNRIAGSWLQQTKYICGQHGTHKKQGVTPGACEGLSCTLYDVYFQELMLSVVIPVHTHYLQILLWTLNAPIGHGMLLPVQPRSNVRLITVSQTSFIKEVCIPLDLVCRNIQQKKMTGYIYTTGARVKWLNKLTLENAKREIV
jgi:hypothetical protein